MANIVLLRVFFLSSLEIFGDKKKSKPAGLRQFSGSHQVQWPPAGLPPLGGGGSNQHLIQASNVFQLASETLPTDSEATDEILFFCINENEQK